MSDAAHPPFRRLRLSSAARPALLAFLMACGDSATGLVDKVTPTVQPASSIALMTPFDSASPLERASGDSQPSVVALQLRDGAGQPVRQAGRVVTLSVLEPGGAPSTRVQILRGGTTPTDTAGMARIFGLVLAGRAGDALLSAKVDTLPALTFPIRLKAGAVSASASAVTVSPDTVPVGGVAQVIVIPMDASGNKRGPDQQVTALLDGNQALATVSTFTYAPADSSYRGTITVTAVSAARALRTNVNGVALTIAPLFTGIAAVTPPVAASALRFAVLPGDTTGAYRTLSGAIWPATTVQLVDASGNAVRQAGVAIAGRVTTTTGGTLANATLLNAGPVSTNAAGQAVFPGISLTAPAGAARVRFEATNLTATSLPVQIVPGVVSTTSSTLTVSRDSVLVDSSITIRVTPRDAAGSALGSGQTVALTTTGGTSTGTLSAVTYNAADSTYRATFTGTATGTATTLRATVNGSQLFASLPLTVIVPPGLVVASSPVTLTPDTIGVAGVAQLVTTPLNGAGRKLGAGQTVTVSLAGGTSAATIGTATYSAADSSYRVSLTGTTVGTTTTATTTVNGVVLTATRPLTVSAAAPPADPATTLRITSLPGDTTAGGLLIASGALMNGVTVSLRSASGAAVAQAGVPITVTAVTNSGAVWTGATVSGAGPLSTTADGTIVFPALRISAPVGSGRLRFSATGLTATSLPVRVTAGAVSSTASTFTLTPDTVGVGAASAAVVTLRDAQNNKIGSGQTVTFALGATGTSTITVGATSFNASDSTYRASLSGTGAGTARVVTASVSGTALGTTRSLTVIAAASADVTATVDGNTTYTISRFIYGANFAEDAGVWGGSPPPASITFNRFGGNRLSAYNWETNYSNAGSDYQYQNDQYLSSSTSPAAAITARANPTFAKNQAYVATIAMLPFVAGNACNCNVGTTEAGLATRMATHFKKNQAIKGSAFTMTPSPTDATVYQDEFVNWLATTYPGRATHATAPLFFSLDNEPDLWHNTHEEILPDYNDNSATPRLQEYQGFTDTSIVYAKAVKSVLPDAMVFGPATATYTGVAVLGRYPTPDPIYGTQNFFDVYLDKMRAASTAYGRRLLDVLDLHFYSEANTGGNVVTNDFAPQDAAMINARVQAPRSLWDPTYDEGSWVNSVTGGPIRLIPRLRDQIAARYPGTKIAITEYSYGRTGDISGGVAQADVLGIFGREGVFAASVWPLTNIYAAPWSGNGTLAYAYLWGAFKVYRDYDGAGSTFGETGLSASTSNASLSSVYASRTATGKVVLVAINKAQTTKTIRITLGGVGSPTGAKVYVMQNGSPNPTRGTDATVSGGAITYTMPALSVSVFELTP